MRLGVGRASPGLSLEGVAEPSQPSRRVFPAKRQTASASAWSYFLATASLPDWLATHAAWAFRPSRAAGERNWRHFFSVILMT